MEHEQLMRERLRNAIENSGMSQRAIAAKAGVSEGTIRNAVGSGNITIENIYAICRALGISLASLVSDDEDPPPSPLTPPESEEMVRLMRDLTPEERKKALDIVLALKYGHARNKKAS